MLHLKTSTLLSEFLLLGWCLSNPRRDEVQQNTILRTAAINACAKGDGQWRMVKGRSAAGKNGIEWVENISRFLNISHTIDPGCFSCPWHFSFFWTFCLIMFSQIFHFFLRRMAIELLGMMADDSLERSTVTYSSVISACERAGEWTVTRFVFFLTDEFVSKRRLLPNFRARCVA